MSSRLFVRAASKTDIVALVELNHEVQDLHAELEPTHFKAITKDDEVATFFGCKLDVPKNHFPVAELDGRPVGYIWFEIQEKSETPFALARRRAYVHHIVVRRNARRQGVASDLLCHVDAACEAIGIRRVALDTWLSTRQRELSSESEASLL